MGRRRFASGPGGGLILSEKRWWHLRSSHNATKVSAPLGQQDLPGAPHQRPRIRRRFPKLGTQVLIRDVSETSTAVPHSTHSNLFSSAWRHRLSTLSHLNSLLFSSPGILDIAFSGIVSSPLPPAPCGLSYTPRVSTSALPPGARSLCIRAVILYLAGRPGAGRRDSRLT